MIQPAWYKLTNQVRMQNIYKNTVLERELTIISFDRLLHICQILPLYYKTIMIEIQRIISWEKAIFIVTYHHIVDTFLYLDV